jgi:Xaa-Pro aminopeptidase
MNELLLKEIRKSINEKKLDAIIVTDIYKIFNLLGIEVSFNIIEIGFYLLVTEKELFLVGDPFSFSLVKIPKGVKIRKTDIKGIREEGFSPLYELRELIKRLKVKRIGSFDNIKLSKLRIVEIPDPFTHFFLMPDEMRVAVLKENALICEKVLKRALLSLKDGVSEIFLRNVIDEEIYEAGGERRAFPTRVIFGKNTSNPFALSNNERLKEGDAIIINFGIIRLGVGIEISRTYTWKTTGKFLKRTYDDITEIYSKFLSFISYGKIAKELYNYVLELMKKKSYEKNFLPPVNAPLTLIGKAMNISEDAKFIIKEGTILYPQLSLYFPGEFGIKFQDVFYLSGKEFNLTNFLNKGEANVISDKIGKSC